MSVFSRRPFDYDLDCLRYAEVRNREGGTRVTEESLRRDDAMRHQEGLAYQQMTVVNGDDIPVGFSYAGRGQWESAGKIRINVLVDSVWRRQGIGSLLFENALQWAEGQAASMLVAGVRDNDPPSLAFAQRHDFVIDRQRFVSLLEVAAFDDAPFSDVIATKEREGLRFVSLADLGDTEEYRRKLYDINMLAVRDEPAFDGTIPTYEEFSRMVYSAWWFRADGQFLAFDGEQTVGISAVGYDAENHLLFNAFTGTHPDYRGRGVGLALKLKTIHLAKEQGIPTIRTNNDSKNPAMLAINEKLGYVRQPGQYQLKRVL